jgi:uncharacterized protein
MKLQPDKSSVQTITGYGPGWIAVDGERISSSVVISSTGLRQPWDCRTFSELTPQHFALLAGIKAELVIFGSGDRIRFPSPAWLAPLMARRIGLETMDTRAACRTYNILSGEGRLVAGAFLIEDSAR